MYNFPPMAISYIFIAVEISTQKHCPQSYIHFFLGHNVIYNTITPLVENTLHSIKHVYNVWTRNFVTTLKDFEIQTKLRNRFLPELQRYDNSYLIENMTKNDSSFTTLWKLKYNAPSFLKSLIFLTLQILNYF